MNRSSCPECGLAIDAYNAAVYRWDKPAALAALARYDEHREARHQADEVE